MFTRTLYSKVYASVKCEREISSRSNRNEGQLLEQHEHTYALSVTDLSAYQSVSMKCRTVLIQNSIAAQVMTDQSAFVDAFRSSPIELVPLVLLAVADARYHM